MLIKNLLSIFTFILLIFSNNFVCAQNSREKADFLLGQKFLHEKKFSQANKLFKGIVLNYQDSSLVSYSKLMDAYCNFNLGRYKDAIAVLQDFIETCPKNLNLEYAHYLKMLSHINYILNSSSIFAYLERSEQVQEAIDLAEDFIFEFPSSLYLEEMKKKLDFINKYAIEHKLNEKAAIVPAEKSFINGQKALHSQIKKIRGRYRKISPDYKKAAKEFDKIYLEHPGSNITKYAEIMEGYSLYMAGKYLDAIDILDVFIELHPADINIEYAYYLKILSHINEVGDVSLGQDHSTKAVETISALIENFPDTKYAANAQKKLVLARNYLAGNLITIGNFYTTQSNPLAALRRYDQVITEYSDSIYYPEALYRSIISFKMLGLDQEAMHLENILKTSYKENYWTKLLGFQFPHKEIVLKPKDIENSKQLSSVKK